jgi:hypothetical protein
MNEEMWKSKEEIKDEEMLKNNRTREEKKDFSSKAFILYFLFFNFTSSHLRFVDNSV